MALPELQTRLAHLYDSQKSPDAFGRRPATPNEILRVMQPQSLLNHEEAVDTGLINIDWKELKKQREERRIAARSLKSRRR